MGFRLMMRVVLQRQRLAMLPPLINDVIISLNYLIALPRNKARPLLKNNLKRI